MIGVTFKEFYMSVSLIYKDNELYPNYHFQVTRKWPEAQYRKG